MTEPGIEPEIFPSLEGRSAIWAISVRLQDKHIPVLCVFTFHPILHMADLKNEKEKFLKQWKTAELIKKFQFLKNC